MLNGVIITLGKLQPFVVTLATWSILEGCALTVLPAETSGVPKAWVDLAHAVPFGLGVPAILLAALIVLWVVLHQRRLRDAGRVTATTIGIAMVYALEVVLLTILVWLILSTSGSSNDGAGSEATILQLFVLVYFMSLLAGDASLGALQYWIMGFAVLMILPVAIALCFSLWAGTRPSVGQSVKP